MTEKLQTLMREQADTVDFAAPDLDAMIAAGDRRTRHRRLGAVAGVAAAIEGLQFNKAVALIYTLTNGLEKAAPSADRRAAADTLLLVTGPGRIEKVRSAVHRRCCPL